MEKNRFAAMLSVSKATGHLHDRLYFAVQSLGNGIGYTMFELRQTIGKATFQGFGRFDHGPETTVSSPEILALNVFLTILRIGVIPKMPQRFLHGLAAARFQFHLPDLIKFSPSLIRNRFTNLY